MCFDWKWNWVPKKSSLLFNWFFTLYRNHTHISNTETIDDIKKGVRMCTLWIECGIVVVFLCVIPSLVAQTKLTDKQPDKCAREKKTPLHQLKQWAIKPLPTHCKWWFIVNWLWSPDNNKVQKIAANINFHFIPFNRKLITCVYPQWKQNQILIQRSQRNIVANRRNIIKNTHIGQNKRIHYWPMLLWSIISYNKFHISFRSLFFTFNGKK